MSLLHRIAQMSAELLILRSYAQIQSHTIAKLRQELAADRLAIIQGARK
jgi:hypothetical protein